MEASSQHCVQVNLRNKVDIAKTLSRVVSTSFGPSCMQTMLTTSTGAVVMTSQGIAILRSLQISHPLGRLIVDAASTHHKSVGDGTKTLILLLEHSMLAVQDIVNKESGSHLGSTYLKQQMDNYLSNKIALALGHFSNTILSEVFIEAQKKADVICGHCCMHLLKNKMADVLLTTFSSHLSSALSKFFATLLMDSIFSRTELQSLESLKQNVEFILDNFEFMHVKSSGHIYTESRTISGFLLHRNFSFLSDHLSKEKIRCVLMRCSMEGILIDDNATIRLKNEDSLKESLTIRLNNTKIFLHNLQSKGVTLILSTEKVPEFVLSLCRKFNISVISYLEEDDMMFIDKISGKFCIHSASDVVDDTVIIDVTECRRVPVGGQIYVQLDIEKQFPKQLILCSPTDGMCHQLGNIIYKGFKSLFSCFQSNRVCSQDDVSCCRTNKSEELLTLSSDHFSDVDSFLDNSLNDSLPAANNRIALSGAFVSDEISMGNDVMRNKISLDSFVLSNETSLDNDVMRNKASLDDHTKFSNRSNNLTFVTFPGGGYFEYLIAELLDQRMKSCPKHELSWCCQVLAKSLRAIPFVIHKNLSHNANIRSFLDKDKRIRAALKKNCAAGFNSRGCVCDPSREDIAEPPFAKFFLLSHVVQLLQQLLRIDGIVGVKALKTKPDDLYQ